MDKLDRFIDLTLEMKNIYQNKNSDYGDSFGETYEKLGLISAVTRISDKTNRLQSLCINDQKVKDENIRDTLMDLANYAVMSVIELDCRGKQQCQTIDIIQADVEIIRLIML